MLATLATLAIIGMCLLPFAALRSLRAANRRLRINGLSGQQADDLLQDNLADHYDGTAEASRNGPNETPHVFISYAHEDEDYQDLVHQLAARLRGDGIDAHLDSWHLNGRPFPDFMASEVRNAQKILVLLSPKYRAGVHSMQDGHDVSGRGWEAMLISTQLSTDYANRNKLVLTIARGGLKDAVPDSFRGFRCESLPLDAFDERAYQRVLHQLRDVSSLPRLQRQPVPVAPLGSLLRGASLSRNASAAEGGASEHQGYPDDKAFTSNLPARRTFVGRDKELADIEKILDAGNGPAYLTLWGLGGVGKTALALEYAHRSLERKLFPGGIWWAVAEGQPKQALARLERLRRREDGGDTTLAVISLRERLGSVPVPSLLVLDNVSEAGFADLLPGGLVSVLLTTRDRRLTLPLGKRLPVTVPSRADALEFAIEQEGTEPPDEAEAAALGRVVDDQLGRLPVAIEVAKRAVAYWAHSWVAYEGHIKHQPGDAFDAPDDRSEHYPRGVFASIDLSMNRCGKDSLLLLEAASILAPDAVPLDWVCGAASVGSDHVATLRAIGELEGLGLVRMDRDSREMSLHRLVHTRTRARALAHRETWQATSRRISKCVAEWMERKVTQYPCLAIDERRPHIDAVLTATLAIGDLETWSRIANPLARHVAASRPRSWDLGFSSVHEDAQLVEAALAFDEVAFGSEPVARALTKLAKSVGTADGIHLLRRALNIRQNAFGMDHAIVAQTLSALGKLLQANDGVDEARQLYTRAVAINEKADPAHPELAMNFYELAYLSWITGDKAAALALLERALKIASQNLTNKGREHAAQISALRARIAADKHVSPR